VSSRASTTSQSRHEKILRLSHFSRPRTRLVSLTCQAAGATSGPQILLTNLKTKDFSLEKLFWVSGYDVGPTPSAANLSGFAPSRLYAVARCRDRLVAPR